MKKAQNDYFYCEYAQEQESGDSLTSRTLVNGANATKQCKNYTETFRYWTVVWLLKVKGVVEKA